MNILFKFLLLFKKIEIIVILKNDDSDIFELISSVFESYIKNEKINLPLNKIQLSKIFKNNVVMIEMDPENKKNLKQLNFLIKKSLHPILIIEKDLIDRELGAVNFILKASNKRGMVIIDSKNSKKINFGGIDIFRVGFIEESDLQVSDLNVSENTNFKVSHDGDMVPFWFNKSLNQDELKTVLLAIATGMAFDLNLVKISQNLKK